ncbi:MAG: hypothetical protein QOF52_704 [Propionibacteriaceae bacterium]|jgi:hypothetical protein|nr:hypothetical protein [Propionibacteriaceae bacterium]MDX6320846.1 hypothetical protein [Propionibacteriaceae bacterium]
MSVDFVVPQATASSPGHGSLVPLRQPHTVLDGQQAFISDCARVMLKASASGQRLVVALYLALTYHVAAVSTAEDGTVHLTCCECRSDGREPGAQYPCPTAQQAFWALDAVLS